MLLSPALAKPQELLELEQEKPGSAEVISNDMLAQAVLAQSTASNNPYDGFGGLFTYWHQGIDRESSFADRVCESKGPFLPKCDASHGPQDVSHSSCRRGLPTVDGPGSMMEYVAQSIWSVLAVITKTGIWAC